MLDLKRGRICHLDHHDFPFQVRLGNDPWLDFGDLRRRHTRPKKETQRPKSAKHLHCPPLGPVAMLCAANLRAVSRRMARYNCATRLTYRKTSREEYARPHERIWDSPT